MFSSISVCFGERPARLVGARPSAPSTASGSDENGRAFATNAAERADEERDAGATGEIAADVSAECHAADGQGDESHDLTEDRLGAISRYGGGSARKLMPLLFVVVLRAPKLVSVMQAKAAPADRQSRFRQAGEWAATAATRAPRSGRWGAICVTRRRALASPV